MAICDRCNGAGGFSGAVLPCYRCGGSGRAGFDNIACAACGGSGQSTQRQWDTCLRCSGSGRIADPAAPRPRTQRPQRRGTPPAAAPGRKPWTRAQIAVAIGVYPLILVVAWRWVGSVEEGIVAAVLALFPAAFVGRNFAGLLVLAALGAAVWFLAGQG